jgi:hypothetical protein
MEGELGNAFLMCALLFFPLCKKGVLPQDEG